MCSSDESFITATSDVSFVSADDYLPTVGETLHNIFTAYPKNFNICHINAQSVPAHYDDILDTFNFSTIHAVFISESWLKPTLPSAAFSIPSFTLIRNDRTGKRGGGVAIYLKKHIPYKIILQSPSSYSFSPEHIFIEVDLGVKLLVGVIYCPPTLDYFSLLETELENLLSDYNRLLIVGDFNTCMISNDSRSRKLRSMIDSTNLNLLDLSPTHHTHTNDTLLDLILTTDTYLVSTHGQISAPAFSHHDLIYASVKIKVPKIKPLSLNQRNFKRMNVSQLESDAAAVDWMIIEQLDTVDQKVDFITKNILCLFDRHAPVRPVKLKHQPTPWFNDSIRKARLKRDRAFRKYKSNRTEENWVLYKKLRNRCNLLCRSAKRRHIAEQIELSTPAGIWKLLRSLGIGKPTHQDLKLPFDVNVLNKHFSTSDRLDQISKDSTLLEIACMPRPDISPFEFLPISQDTIQKTALSLKSKAMGNDDIGRIMILHILDHILPALTHIVNWSLDTGQYPDQWRKALVIPLPKVPNPVLLNQFRPISILPFLSKVIESVVHKQVSEYLVRSSLLNPFQSGFRPGHSTTTALLKVTEDIRKSMENAQITILVLIDFSNAFNAVNHDLLLAIFSHLHFSPNVITWFSSYLMERRQAIRTGQTVSDWCELEAGVPQGGILSPLLFSIFINMLSKYLHCQYHFYADDLQLYQHCSTDNVSSTIASLNADLTHLLSWSKRYGIQVNPSKCQAIVIGSSRQLSKLKLSIYPPLHYNNCIIPFTQTVKNLGILVDSNLNWTAQVKEVSRKFFASLHSILRFKYFLPINTKISLVNSLLLPILDYADVCYLNITEEHLNKLDRLLNAGIRFIYGLRKYDHVSVYRKKLKWLPIRERRNYRILGLLYSILFDRYSPEYLTKEFNFVADSHALNLRSTNSLRLLMPVHKTNFVDNSFGVTAVRLWNQLPLNIKKAPSKHAFKLSLRKHYLNKLYNS